MFKRCFLTTITWDKKILCADTLVSFDTAALTGMSHARGWEIKSKLFTPGKVVMFEGAPIIAVGAAGNGAAGNSLRDWLFDQNLKPGYYPRPSAPLRNDLIRQAQISQVLVAEDSWLFVLTETHCWHVTSVIGIQPTVDDVTTNSTAIGLGAKYARPCLAKGLDGVDAIIEAATHTDSETNFKIESVQHKPGSQIKLELRSLTTLKDPVRKNRVLACVLGTAGHLLTAIGGVSLLAGGFEGLTRLLWVAALMLGVMVSGWSMLTSFRSKRAPFYALGALILMLAPLAIPETEAFIVANNLESLIVLPWLAFAVLYLPTQRFPALMNPLIASYIVSVLSVIAVLVAVVGFNDPPYNWAEAFVGFLGVGVGFSIVWLCARHIESNERRFWHLFDL